MLWHVRSWQATQREKPSAKELDFRRRQFRRRIQTTAMLGLLAVAILVGHWITGAARLFYWGAVLLLVAWMVLLALVDVWATRWHVGRMQREIQLQQVKLRAKLRSRKKAP